MLVARLYLWFYLFPRLSPSRTMKDSSKSRGSKEKRDATPWAPLYFESVEISRRRSFSLFFKSNHCLHRHPPRNPRDYVESERIENAAKELSVLVVLYDYKRNDAHKVLDDQLFPSFDQLRSSLVLLSSYACTLTVWYKASSWNTIMLACCLPSGTFSVGGTAGSMVMTHSGFFLFPFCILTFCDFVLLFRFLFKSPLNPHNNKPPSRGSHGFVSKILSLWERNTNHQTRRELLPIEWPFREIIFPTISLT